MSVVQMALDRLRVLLNIILLILLLDQDVDFTSLISKVES